MSILKGTAPSATFEPDHTLDQVMALFWKRGYAGTSFDQLVSGARTNRYRFYSAFGGKDDLLDQAIERYSRRVVDSLVEPLEDPGASLREIRQLFRGVETLHRRTGSAGCLICNTAVERGQAGSAPARRVRRHFTRLRGLFARALANARRNGELPATLGPAGTADYLVGVVAGSFLLARARMPGSLVTAFLRTALDALPERPRPEKHR